MVKFSADTPLQGYGFDLQADRVVRFNKYPDGTYLNTRATYSINQRMFTHYELRQYALDHSSNKVVSSNKGNSIKTYTFKVPLFVLLIGVLLIIALPTSCSVTGSFDTTTSINTKEE